jgi:hypothetical protein
MQSIFVYTFIIGYFAGELKKAQPKTKPAKRLPGRPRTGKVRVQVKLSPKAWDLIRQRAAKLGISRSDYIERAVLAAARRESRS